MRRIVDNSWGVAVALLVGLTTVGFSPKPPPEVLPESSIERSLELAREALGDRVRTGGLLSECRSSNPRAKCELGGKPNILTIHFLVRSMGRRLGDDLHEVVKQLYESESQGRWSYSKGVRQDSDDSAYALLTLLELGVQIDVEPIFDFYFPHLQAFSTFKNRFPRGMDPELVVEQTGFVGENRMLHPEVNLNVFRLLKSVGWGDVVNYDLVADSFSSVGHAHSFYYPSKYYATWMAIDLVSQMDEFKEEVGGAVTFIEATQNPDGSWGDGGDPWDTVLAMNALFSAGLGREALQRGAEYLLDRQSDDGMWYSQNVIWVYPFDLGRDPGYWSSYDSSGVLTTSLAIIVLEGVAGLEEIR